MVRRGGRIKSAGALDPRRHQILSGRLFDVRELLDRPRYENEAIIRSLCYNTFLGNKTSLCRVLGRFEMFVDTTDVGLSTHLLTQGFWEIWHTEAMARLIEPGMTAVDVGANLGYFTLLMSELVPEGAFTPSSPMPRSPRGCARASTSTASGRA